MSINGIWRKRVAWAALCVGACVASPVHGATIAFWGFETVTPPDATDAATNGPHNPDQGTGQASGVHASAASDWTTPAGNGSANSYSVNTWTTGDYFQFVTSTVGQADIFLQWDQTRSSTGPATFDLQYSTDGTNFLTALDDYTVASNDAAGGGPWTSGGSRIASYVRTVDLSAINAIENQPSVTFRLVSQVTPAAGGTNRVDNFLVSQGPPPEVPEPTSLGVLGVVAAAMVRRRRRRA